jgi:hypothetical protein
LFYVDVNLLGDNIDAIKRSIEALIYANEEVGLEGNTEICCLKTKIRIYKIIILPMALYGLETWSLILREEHG